MRAWRVPDMDLTASSARMSVSQGSLLDLLLPTRQGVMLSMTSAGCRAVDFHRLSSGQPMQEPNRLQGSPGDLVNHPSITGIYANLVSCLA